jgi:WD40 repeat protein
VGAAVNSDVKIWDVESGQEFKRFAGHTNGVDAVAFLPGNRRILTGGAGEPTQATQERDYSIRLWDVASGREIHRFNGHREKVTSLAVSPDGATALSGSMDGTMIHWRLPK